MNDFLNRLYTSPWGRMTRRFVVAGLAAAFALLWVKVPVQEPLAFANAVLALTATDWLNMLKIFAGAGVLATLDKLRREWKFLLGDDSTSEQ